MSDHSQAFNAALSAIATLIEQESEEADHSSQALDLGHLYRAQSCLYDFQRGNEGLTGASDFREGQPIEAAEVELITKSQDLIYKALPAIAPISTDEDAGIVTAILNTTAITDLQRDKILPGAWASVLRSASKVKILVSHEHHALPLGKMLSLDEWMPGDFRLPAWHQAHGAGALVGTFKVDLNRQGGRDLWAAIKGGYVSEYSVGFLADGDYFENNDRIIPRIASLVECSAVLRGASPETMTLSVKSADSKSDGLPDWLCDLIELMVAEELTDHALAS
jgi:HK97 family phage prohead protease